jgi:predicted permease
MPPIWLERVRQVLSLRWRSVATRDRAERDLDDEIRYHVETEIDRLIAGGLDPDAARRAVLRRFGGVEAAKERCRDARGVQLVETIAADVQYAVRALRRSRGFTAAAVLTLALGIGANAAVFSLADGLMLAPLPYPDPSRLVAVTGTYPGGAFDAMRREVRTIDVAAYADGKTFTLAGDGEPVRVSGTLVSAELLPLLGVRPALGRWLRPGEDVAPRDRYVILSASLWKTRYGRDPQAIGRSIDVNGVRREIIAVMPADFQFPSASTQVWVPLGLDSREAPRYWAGDFMPIVGRLAGASSAAQAHEDVRAFQTRVPALFPWKMPADWNKDVAVVPLREAIVGGVRSRVMLLLAAVAVVLLVACANVANLGLSRAFAREREIAIRAAIGAWPARIARQLLTESVVLAILGAVAGLAVGAIVLAALKQLLPPDTPRLAQVHVSARAVVVSGVLAMLTGCAVGIAPVLYARRLRLRSALESGGRSGGGATSTPVRRALTIGQVACAVLLVIAAGLLVRSVWRLSRVDPGFNPDRIVTARVSPPESVCASADRCLAFYRLLDARLEDAGQLRGAAMINTLPLTGAVAKRSLDVEGFTVPAGETAPLVWMNVITPGYFRVMDVRVDAGRAFSAADVSGDAPVAIVSAATARRFWPGQNPVGRHIRFVGEETWREIVGVVGDVRAYDLTKTVPEWIAGTIYVPHAANGTLEDGRLPAAMTIVARTSLEPARVAAILRGMTDRGDVVIDDVRRMREIVADRFAAPAATASLLVSIAVLAVTIGCVGVYGVLSFLVARRFRDFGIRVALGAQPRHVFWSVMKEATALCLGGVAIGIVGAAVLTRWMSTELYGVSPTDPLTYLSVSFAVVLVTLAASSLPTRRALGVDPLIVLREQ